MVTSWLVLGLIRGLLLLPGCVSQSWVVAGRGHQGLRALETARKRTGVHGDVPLPRVDVGRPGGGNLGVGVGGAGGVGVVLPELPPRPLPPPAFFLLLPFLPVPLLLGGRDGGAGMGAGGLAATGVGQV
jgi:hypothetical protein